jgi:hypothetical protein
VQGALDADLRKPYFLDNSVGNGQLMVEIQLADGEVMEVYVPYLRLTFGSSFAYVLAQVGLALVLFGAGDLVHAPRAGADRASRRRRRRAGQGARCARLRLLGRHARGAQCRDRLSRP